MRLASLFVLLAVAGCREAPPALTTADLQGDWIVIGVSGPDGAFYRDIGFEGFTIRGDSLRSAPASFEVGSRGLWEPVAARITLRTLSGDTLVADHNGVRGKSFVRLTLQPGAPRPYQIGLFLGGCFGGCPVLGVQIDSTGTLRYSGERLVPHEGDFSVSGSNTLYHRASELAAALRLDRPFRTDDAIDDQSVLIGAWYGDSLHVFPGTSMEMGALSLLVAELTEAAFSVPADSIASASPLDIQTVANWLWNPNPDRPPIPATWVFTPPDPAPPFELIRRPGPDNRVLMRLREPLPGLPDTP